MGRGHLHIGLFGGSFDPPHICHLLFCTWALEMAKIDRILWVPCAAHPFGKPMASMEHRLAMSRMTAALLGDRVEVSAIENELPRPSYTIHTVEEIQRRHPDDRLSLLVGSDILGEIDRWERADELRQKAELVVVPRGGYEQQAGEPAVSLPALSSTEIREALREGRSVEGAVTPAVLEYIRNHHLYIG